VIHSLCYWGNSIGSGGGGKKEKGKRRRKKTEEEGKKERYFIIDSFMDVPLIQPVTQKR